MSESEKPGGLRNGQSVGKCNFEDDRLNMIKSLSLRSVATLSRLGQKTGGRFRGLGYAKMGNVLVKIWI